MNATFSIVSLSIHIVFEGHYMNKKWLFCVSQMICHVMLFILQHFHDLTCILNTFDFQCNTFFIIILCIIHLCIHLGFKSFFFQILHCSICLYKNVEKIPASDHFIVQEYIDKPFLVDGYKCDLRIYVLVTSCDPLKIFLFNDGLLRMSTERYIHPQDANLVCLFHMT